ncbi:MAG: cupin domain-containing protein [Pseudomonadota bacterium]
MTGEINNDAYDDFLNGIDRLNEKPQGEPSPRQGIAAGRGAGETGDLGPVGDRVRQIREQKKLSLSDVSSRTGFEVDFLSRIEANEVSPPLGVLIKLGKALDMKMGFFISGGENRAFTVVRADERQNISRRASTQDTAYGYTYQALAPGKTNRHMEPLLVTLEPCEKLELSTHEGQEFIFVLEGKMEAILDQERLILSAGDSIYYDSGTPHQVRCCEGPFTRILAVLYAHEK